MIELFERNHYSACCRTTALVDLLYLYPFYDNRRELEKLRLDEDFLQHDFSREQMQEYNSVLGSKALDKRIKLLQNVYGL